MNSKYALHSTKYMSASVGAITWLGEIQHPSHQPLTFSCLMCAHDTFRLEDMCILPCHHMGCWWCAKKHVTVQQSSMAQQPPYVPCWTCKQPTGLSSIITQHYIKNRVHPLATPEELYVSAGTDIVEWYLKETRQNGDEPLLLLRP